MVQSGKNLGVCAPAFPRPGLEGIKFNKVWDQLSQVKDQELQ